METIAVIVRNEQKGLYASMGLHLMSTSNVIFIVDNRDAATVITRICEKKKPKIIVEPNYRSVPQNTTMSVAAAKVREIRYGIRYAQLVSMDRATGRGYQQNIDGYPWVKRADWSRDEKLEIINQKFEFFETSLKNVDVLISQWPEPVSNLVCDRNGIKHYHLLQARFGERLVWSDTSEFFGSNHVLYLKESLELALRCPEEIDPVDFEVDAVSAKLLQKAVKNYQLFATIKAAATNVWHKFKLFLLGRGKQNSYVFPDFLPVIFRRRNHYLFLERFQVTPKALSQDNLFYFPLHMEPELALLQFTNEFNNVFEAISWVSRALPADSILVVKENPKTLGHRNLLFYKKIAAMPNVLFSRPDVLGVEWISKANVIVTMAGTAGEEAIYFEKPVITFGQRQIINYLPTVFLTKTYQDVRLAVDKIVSGEVTKEQLMISKLAFGNAMHQISFELTGYTDNYHSDKPDLERSRIALDNLLRQFPACFS